MGMYDTPKASGDGYGAPLYGNEYQALGMATVSAQGQYDPLRHGKSASEYSSLGVQSVENSSDYNHFERKGGYAQSGDGANRAGVVPGYDHAQLRMGEPYAHLGGAPQTVISYDVLKHAHSQSSHGVYQQQAGDNQCLSSARKGAEHVQGGNGEAPRRSRGDEDEDGQYFDVSCGAAAPRPPPLPPKRAPQPQYDLASQLTSYEDVPLSVMDTAPALTERHDVSAKPELECVAGEDAWVFLQIVTGCSLALSSGTSATLVSANGAPTGSFIVRRSTRATNGLVLTFNSDGNVIHEHITATAKGKLSLCGRACKTLSRLLEKHRRLCVGATTTKLAGFAPVITQATAAGLGAALGSEGAPEVEVDACGRPTGSWPVGALLRVAQAAVESGAAAAASNLPPAGAAAIGIDTLLSMFVGHWRGGASASSA
jgi:hypothetical protein